MPGFGRAPIFSASSGEPFTVFDCTLAQNNCPRYAPFTPTQLQSSNSGTSPTSGSNSFDYLVLPPSISTPNPVVGSLGGFSDLGPYPATMTGRNIFRGPGHWNLDFGIYKNFRVTEGVRLQFCGEMFNAFNHANLFVVGTTVDVASSPLSPGMAGCPMVDGAGSCPLINAKRGGLGINLTSDTRERRNVQFGLKLIF